MNCQRCTCQIHKAFSFTLKSRIKRMLNMASRVLSIHRRHLHDVKLHWTVFQMPLSHIAIRRPRDPPLLAPVHSLCGLAEAQASAVLHLNKNNTALMFRDRDQSPRRGCDSCAPEYDILFLIETWPLSSLFAVRPPADPSSSALPFRCPHDIL